MQQRLAGGCPAPASLFAFQKRALAAIFLAMNIVVFEDTAVRQLFPVTTGRPAYAITCGGYRLVDWLRKLDSPVRGIVRPYLQEIQSLDYADLAAAEPVEGRPTLMINARLVPSVEVFQTLQHLLESPRPGVIRQGDSYAAVLLPEDAPLPINQVRVGSVVDYFHYAGASELDVLDVELPLIDYPHDVVRHHLEILPDSLAYRLQEDTFQEIADGVFAAPGARLGEYTVTDTREGPVILEENVSVGPHSYLSGPALLGRDCRVNEHAAVKDAVVLGHTTKIGGEIEASIVEPYTNKQHYGFLGHSYLGSWINLGAGTCNSDLKNTYGTVNMEYGTSKVATGMQFLGCIMGDYAKTAINTGVFTGKTIGSCSMVYGYVTTNVPSFVNYARLFGQVTELPPEVMASTQQRMFARRRVPQRPCDIQLLHAMYEHTREERQLAGEPLSL
jgi:glucose-1-phosphate thymidylyltransferase